MKKLMLLATAMVLGVSSAGAEQTGYERRAFEGRYGLWKNVRCVAGSVNVILEGGHSLTASYPASQMEADARSDLARLAFPKFCEGTPGPATMASVEMDVRTLVDDDGSVVYFVRLLAAMPDGDFVRKNVGQFTSWESRGKLGLAEVDRGRETLRDAMAEQISEFAEFMRRARALRNG